MKLEIPFFKQTTRLNCGPSALRMILAYFGKDPGMEILEEKTGIKKGKGTYTIQMATAATSLGHRTDFYSKHVLSNEENLKLDFYAKYGDIAENSKKLVEDAKMAGVNIQEKILSLEELLGFVTKDSIPIVLIDWNIVTSRMEKGYQGHFSPIVGYDSQNVYVHNHGLNNPQEFMPIERAVFDKARKVAGTDEDIVIIYKK